MIKRVKKRLEGENPSDDILEEFIDTVRDRLCIRLGEEKLPDIFHSICVDAVVKMYRRIYYEGISSEGSANISTSFVDNVLAEYEQEISEWKERKANTSGTERKVRFL